jgi:hypothetical protein
MSDTDFEPISPETEQRPDTTIPVFDSDAALAQLPPEDLRQIIPEGELTGESLTPREAADQLRRRRGEQPASGNAVRARKKDYRT